MTKEDRIWEWLYLGETNVAKIAKACKCSKAMVRRMRERNERFLVRLELSDMEVITVPAIHLDRLMAGFVERTR